MELTSPYLEHHPGRPRTPYRIVLDPLPFRIGQSPTAHLVLYWRQVSTAHADIVRVNNEFWIRDLHTTNGTYLNGERVHDARLQKGDISVKAACSAARKRPRSWRGAKRKPVRWM